MNLFLLLIFVSVPFSRALFLPYNSSILQLPSQDTVITDGKVNAVPWPTPPFDRYVRNGVSLNITAYGDTLLPSHYYYVLQALLALQRTILESGKLDEKLLDITTAAATRGNVYVNVGFYNLHPPAGIKVGQAGDVIYKAWQLTIEFFPPKEITESTVLLRNNRLALFRMSFRVGGASRQLQH